MTNAIDGVHIIKLYGWDKGILNLILDARDKEIHKQAYKNLPRVIAYSIMISGLGLIVMFMTWAHLEMGNEMTLSKSIYVMMSVSILLFHNLGYFTMSLATLGKLNVNCGRIGQVLQSKLQ